MSYNLDRICTQIFKFDRRIRYAGVLDETGRLIAGGMRKGISSLEPQSEDLRLMANLTIQIGTDKTWDRYFGNTQYTFIKREKVNIVTFNMGNKLILVSMEPDFSILQIQTLRDTIITLFAQNLVSEKIR